MRETMRTLLSLCLLSIMAMPIDASVAHGQAAGRPTTGTPDATPPARPEDVASEDAIIAALYGAISGPAGQKRDWARFRPLFIPDGRLIVARPPRPEGPQPPRVMTVEEYITGSS